MDNESFDILQNEAWGNIWRNVNVALSFGGYVDNQPVAYCNVVLLNALIFLTSIQTSNFIRPNNIEIYNERYNYNL